jgi:hypothetical protein
MPKLTALSTIIVVIIILTSTLLNAKHEYHAI